MDAFFAAIEQRDNPSLRGQPVVVGGNPFGRGVVATCSYEARQFGIHSAMPASLALRKCPRAIFVKTRFAVYREVSEQIRKIFLSYTDLVEPLSLDEAYLDVTENKRALGSATILAQKIMEQIFQETKLTASAGVSYNKFLAKMASDWKKPNGLTVIVPGKAKAFLQNVSVRKFHGVGAATQKKLYAMGIKTGQDLLTLCREDLLLRFGKMGQRLYEMARGQDDRLVNTQRRRKSLGKETTFQRDLWEQAEIIEQLHCIAHDLCQSMEKRKLRARTLTLKVRLENFQTITKRKTLSHFLCEEEVRALAKELWRFLCSHDNLHGKGIRLLGISLSNFFPLQAKKTDPREMYLPF